MNNKVYVVTTTSEFIGFNIETELRGVFTDKEKAMACFDEWKKLVTDEFNMDLNGDFDDYITDVDDFFSIVTDDNYMSVQIDTDELK